MDSYSGWRLLLPERITLQDVLEAIGYAAVCLSPESTRVCRAWFFDERFRPGHPLPGRSGYGISVHVHQRYHPPSDGMSLLQLYRSQVTRERRTQGLVAHTPGPRDDSDAKL